jgi:hypothetical protein
MQEPSIRTFTLDYFRGLGAEVAPLDSARHRWVVRTPEAIARGERSLRLAFDPAGETSRSIPMAPSHPRWQAILATCTAARPVAYRHIVSEPIVRLLAHFRARLPHFDVQAVELVSVEPRQAIGFTHRVCVHAPILGERRPELHHDLLDAATGERLDELSERFYHLPALPIEPTESVPSMPLETLHRHALDRVDRRTETAGRRLEGDLQGRLLDRLSSLTGPVSEARVAAEVALHEVTVETELVSVSAVTFDEVSYAVTLGAIAPGRTVVLRWVPVTETLVLPACGRCGKSIDPGAPPTWLLSEEMLGCHRCAPPPEAPRTRAEAAIREATGVCARCEAETALTDLSPCHLTGRTLCDACAIPCSACGAPTDPSQLVPHPSGRGMVCRAHTVACPECRADLLADQGFDCAGCGSRLCEDHARTCPDCGAPCCPACADYQVSGCTLCSRLLDVPADHPEIVLARQLLPSLPKTWRGGRIARQGPWLLIEWARFGRRGRALVHLTRGIVTARRQWRAFWRRWAQA